MGDRGYILFNIYLTNGLHSHSTNSTNPLIQDLGGQAASSHLAVDLLLSNYEGILTKQLDFSSLEARVANKLEDNNTLRL